MNVMVGVDEAILILKKYNKIIDVIKAQEEIIKAYVDKYGSIDL